MEHMQVPFLVAQGRYILQYQYRRNPPIRPGLIYEGSVGEGRLQGSYTWSYW